MLAYISATREAFCLLIITPDLITRNVFRDGIEEDMELKVHVNHSSYVNVKIFKIIDVICLFLRSKVTGKQKKFSMLLSFSDR
jgi:hypothetical protein